MSCARNLVKCCEANSRENLFIGTRQIFGLCDEYGNSRKLFHRYVSLVRRLLKNLGSQDTTVAFLHDLVWEPKQDSLRRLLGYEIENWNTMLSVPVGIFQ